MADKKDKTIDKAKADAAISKLTDEFSKTVTGIYETIDTDNGEDFEDDERTAEAKDVHKRVGAWTDIWRNSGKVDAFRTVSMAQMIERSSALAKGATDAVTSQWYRNMLPTVVSNVVREPITLDNPLTRLLTPVRFSQGTHVSFPAVGAAGNINCDMGEGEEYPVLDLDMTGMITATINKSGIAVEFTEEAIRYDSFDIVTMHARQAVDVLRRHKERKAANKIFSIGSTFRDNLSGAFKNTGGRDIDGEFNGTMIVDDLIDASLDALKEGWQLDTIIVHPLAWQIFAKDPILREQFFRGIASGGFVSRPQGQETYFPSLGVNAPYGQNQGPSVATGIENPANGTLTFQVPGYAGFGFNVIVSNYAPFSFDAGIGKYRTDIAMIEAKHAGLLVIDEELATDNWTDPTVDVHKWKFRERYTIVNINAGKAGRVLKNVVVDRAYFMEDKLVWDAATKSLPSSAT